MVVLVFHAPGADALPADAPSAAAPGVDAPGAAAPSAAVPSAAAPGAAVKASDGDTLAEIIITAQRREEPLDKVPISVSAFSQKTMDDLKIESFADLATIVPGLIVSTPSAGFQESSDVAIRGIFSGGNAPTTQFYIDETPVAIRTLPAAGPSGSPHPLIFDLDRVEVLRGPQGTLFGSSAMGGAIRYITPQPSLQDSSGYTKADFSYTDRGQPNYEMGAAYGAPLIDGVAGFRVSAWYRNEGGFIDKENPFTGEVVKRDANYADSYVVRPAVSWMPLDGLTVTPAFYLQHLHQANPDTYWLNDLPDPERGAHASGSIGEPYTDDFRLPSIAVKYDLQGVSLQSDSSFLDRESVAIDDYTHGSEYILSGEAFVPGLSPSFHNVFNDQTYTHAFQQELRVTSQDPSARVSWVAGLYYRNSLQSLVQYIPGSLDPLTEAIAGETTLQYTGNPNYTLDGQVLNGYTNFVTRDVSEAVFGDVDITLLPRLKANLGVRYEHSIIDDQHQIAAGAADGLDYSNVFLPNEVQNPVTPRVGLTFQYTDNDMVYVSAAKGYRAGGGNGATAIGNVLCDQSLKALGLSIVPSSFGSDSLWSYEIGTKNALWDRRLAIQASAFYIDWSNIQTSIPLPSCDEVFTANRGKAVSEGFDLQVAAVVAEGLKLSANLGYTNAYNPNAAYGPSNNGVLPLLNGAGDKLPNVLPWTASASAEYSRDIGAWWSGSRGYLRIDYRWLDAANRLNPAVADYDPLTGPYQNPAYSILNLRVGIIHGGLDLSAYVDNATRSDPALSYVHDAYGDPLFYATAIRPLSMGVTGYYRF